MKKKKICNTCKIEITDNIRIQHNTSANFCRYCYSKYQKELYSFYREDINARERSKRERIIKKCEWVNCNNTFETARELRKCCSPECTRLRKNAINRINGKKRYNLKKLSKLKV